jgi:hypothetical protein
MNPEADWERIWLEYRLGVFSTREIARRHHVPESTIRKRAAARGWEQDLKTLAQEVARRLTPKNYCAGFGTLKGLGMLLGSGFR